MDDGSKASSDALKRLEERLKVTQESIRQRDKEVYGRGSTYSLGIRLAADLIVGVLAGFGIGWLLDRWLDTSPWFLLIFTPLGIVAGILNVIRAANSIEAQRHLQRTAPGEKPDTDK